MQTPIQELRYALRSLRKAPGFTLVAVFTLALGIGATTSIFTLVYDVLLKPLPYRHSERLVLMEEQVAEFRDMYPRLPMNASHFTMWQQNSRSFESMAIMRERSIPLGMGGHPVQVEVLSATPGIFSVLSTTPQTGRPFTVQELESGRERVAILMNDLWRQQFQSDPGILGKTITLNGFPYTVIGVMPRSFHLPVVQSIAGLNADRAKPIEVLVPLAFSKEELQELMGDFNYFGLAQLRPGISVAQANAEINALQHTMSASLSAEERATLSAVLTPYQQALVGNNRKPLLILLAAVAGLLLVGCINITNLLLARAVSRRHQMAVVAALGATRADMLHIAMRETTLLAAVGGVLGILLAAVLVPAMQRYLPPALDFRGTLHFDWLGAGCAVLLVLVGTLVAGAVPAWVSSQTQPQEVLHSESKLASESRSTKQLRRILVGIEVAVSVGLVLMTGLVTASLIRLMRIDRGFEADHILTFNVDLPSKSYSDLQSRTAFYKEVLQRLHQLPDLKQAGLVSTLPVTGDQWIDTIRVRGDARAIMQLPTEHFRWVSPGYFETIHLPLIAGRFLSASDEGGHYAIVSELTARTLWPSKSPIGQQFNRAGVTDELPFTVIGVVGDARTISLAQPDPMIVYMPYWYRSDNTGGLLMRTQRDPAMMADAVRRTIWSIEPEASVPMVRTLDGVIADSVANRRFEMDLLLLFAISSLFLAGLGVYGVVTYSVVQRQREIGLRLAVGAQRTNIYGLVLREGLMPVLVGAVIGIGVALGLGRVVGSVLFQVSPYNPAVVITAVCMLLAVGVVACLLPARRAAAIDPMQSLRAE